MESQSEQLYRLKSKVPHIISLMLLSAFAAMGAIVMTPALPQIANFFGKNVGSTQLVVTSFLLGYAIGQLIYGPLANRYGRKSALYVGIVIATLGSLFSILASPVDSFALLITGRFLEAIGSSAGLVISFAMINDFYFEEQARKITGLLMLAFAIVPGVSTAVGGVLVQYLGWRACFYFLLFYGLLLLIPVVKLPETLINKDFHAVHFKNIFSNYVDKFLNKKLIGYACIAGFSSACVYVFGAEGPFIGIYMLHTPPALYGILSLTPFIGTFIGALIVVRLSKLNSLLVFKMAFAIELSASLVLFFLFIFHFVSLYTLLIPMAFFCIGHPIIGGTILPLSMKQSADKANASAVMNFSSCAMPVAMTFLMGTLHVPYAWIMPVIFLIALALMISLFAFVSGRE
ncbi:MAG: hypothetical protein A3I77_04600 [Gammaproteobacteria bacterium RIFCSPLOWO2_02_FULL_42_14]|nr:MAG: hypothetical protein A3B71_05900 [Gammaproteobacteria bacterium RIFCSPHIGHO2_02_FULL_42_43]OGT28905.1 MAG: hypothetical protein A2624_04945 [Gammaproteobacteria bacterium RIFCSPHIGHO2_01_FULL_42_8]OGT51520.1 MAG: hypothetical protein A3E54_05665 [Gammaproteobacteria bacterium RIFCSPHIGHO2_12_FULL_41_25]OGT62221.1 MAG: hypothetical protein A3I77_04600 [Gammaproteobacteria bacterium RIFCSPLOWO2_02_FULL_42_14]OGT85894.1 MAG: hypothetical protein A3G86_04290 [Gammaproteobacteria bacterium R